MRWDPMLAAGEDSLASVPVHRLDVPCKRSRQVPIRGAAGQAGSFPLQEGGGGLEGMGSSWSWWEPSHSPKGHPPHHSTGLKPGYRVLSLPPGREELQWKWGGYLMLSCTVAWGATGGKALYPAPP